MTTVNGAYLHDPSLIMIIVKIIITTLMGQAFSYSEGARQKKITVTTKNKIKLTE